MENKIDISVVVPMLNSENYLKECLDSVLSQSFKSIEVICVDAGSTDRTLEILEQYKEKDERIKIIHSEIKSYGYQLNIGIGAAKGQYLSIVESDDYIQEGMYEDLFLIAKETSADIIKADFCTFIGNGANREFTHRTLTPDSSMYGRIINPMEELNIFRAFCINPPGIYNIDFLRANNIRLNESKGASYQDNGLWFQMFALANKVILIRKEFYMIRRDNEFSSVFDTKKTYALCKEYDFIRSFLSKNKLLEKKLAPICAYYRFGNYKFTLNRIAESDREQFCYKFSEDFQKIKKDGEIDPMLYSPGQLIELGHVIKDPRGYYLQYWYNRKNRKIKSIKDFILYLCYTKNRVINIIKRKFLKN